MLYVETFIHTLIYKIKGLYRSAEVAISHNLFAKYFLIVVVCYFLAKGMSYGETTNYDRSQLNQPIEYTEDEQLYVAQLCGEVNNWVRRYYPDTQVDINYLVKTCVDNGFPIELCVAQASLESQFGTADNSWAKNKKNYSLYSVGLCDDGKCRCKYSSWEASILPYIRYVQTKCIDEDRTYNDLINDEYVTLLGQRYATDMSYEYKLRQIIQRMRNESQIYKWSRFAQPNVEPLKVDNNSISI